MSTQAPIWQFTVDDFMRMGEVGILRKEDRVELIEGVVIPMDQNASTLAELESWQFSISDFMRMVETGIIDPEARVELVEGKILAMSPIGSRHAGTVAWIATELATTLKGKAVLFPQNPLQIPDFSQLQPDVIVLQYQSDFYRSQIPTPKDVLLLIEVADSSTNFDRDKKMPIYAGAGIPEFWLIDLLKNRLTWYSQPQHRRYSQICEYGISDRIQVTLANQSIELEVAKIFS